MANFYWSLLILPTVPGYFSYQSASPTAVFGSRRLPFGWSYRPVFAPRTLERILLPLVPWFPASLWQYVDDLLLTHTDPHFLAFAGAFAVHLISSSGLLISPKSSLVPTRNITWLGKEICCHFVSNSPARVAQVVLRLWFPRCVAFSPRSLQRLLGSLQWLCSPSSLSSPYFASSYALLQRSPPPLLLPWNVRRSLLFACLYVLRPLHRNPFPSPVCIPMLFCDAAPVSPSQYRVTWFTRNSFATSARAPAWVKSKQTAELYAIFHSLRQASLRHFSHICLVTDNSAAYFTALHGRCTSTHWPRVRILRRINRVCLESNIQLQLAVTLSEHNPADTFSRFAPTTPLQCVVESLSRSNTLFLTRFSHPVVRFWWLPSVFPRHLCCGASLPLQETEVSAGN